MSIFEKLNSINVNDKTEKKNGLTYLSWAWAWGEVKKAFPEATFTIYERDTEYGPVNYFTDGRTCWVKTGLTIEGLEHIEELPVMDFKNKPIPFDAVTSTDVNKAIQRSLTKAAARHGLGLYIYAGEDLPEAEVQGTPGDTKPFTPPEAGKPVVAETTAIPASDTEAYLAECLKTMREVLQITKEENKKLFNARIKALIDAKLIENKSIKAYTKDELAEIFHLMYTKFLPQGTTLKDGAKDDGEA